MAKKTPEQIAEKYQRGVAGAGQDYATGVQNPSRSWSQATAGASGRWRTGVQDAIQNNSFARGVQRAGDGKWQAGALEKGAQNYAAAATRAASQYAQVAAQIMAAGSAAQAKVANMPTDTLDQRIARSAAAQREISSFWKARKSA